MRRNKIMGAEEEPVLGERRAPVKRPELFGKVGAAWRWMSPMMRLGLAGVAAWGAVRLWRTLRTYDLRGKER